MVESLYGYDSYFSTKVLNIFLSDSRAEYIVRKECWRITKCQSWVCHGSGWAGSRR